MCIYRYGSMLINLTKYSTVQISEKFNGKYSIEFFASGKYINAEITDFVNLKEAEIELNKISIIMNKMYKNK